MRCKMKVRKGRLNAIEFVDEKSIRKISVVQEKSRPYRLKIESWALSQARARGINVPRVLEYYRNTEGLEVIVLEASDFLKKELSRKMNYKYYMKN